MPEIVWFVSKIWVQPSEVAVLFHSNLSRQSDALTLAELHVLVLTSFIKLIKLLQKLMKLLGLIEVYYKLISDIIVNDCTTKKMLKSQYIFKNFILFYI